MESFLNDNITDFIALSRPLIYEPNLPYRWKNGDITPPLFTNCNGCITTATTDTTYCNVKMKADKNKKKRN
ncbi:MAG: hypothetical protein ACFFEN_14480 [Candidatus Thorarchaeota archaeon]